MIRKPRTENDLKEIFKVRQGDRKRYLGKKKRARLELPEKVADILPEMFEDNPQALRRLEETRAILAWPTYVGESAADRSQAIKLRGTQLVVKVADPLWMQQLSLLKRGILQRYKKDFPRIKITDIFFTRKL